tara:strand:+ start:29883 stop:30776 length:894 start_codon:yes stop_codon:yes gene_type:complete
MTKKIISIIINCFNGEKYLEKTLNSILKQKIRKYEVIFIDNCSTDSSSQIYRKIKDKRFKYFKTRKKMKLYAARNFALKKAKGEFITFLDTDDWWDKEFLSFRKKFFLSNKKFGFSYSNCLHYYENKNKFEIFSKKKLPSGYILDDLLKYYFVKLGTIILKRELLKDYKFNSFYNIIGDYDFIIRISKKFKGMGFQDKLVNIRIHRNNFTHNNRQMFHKEFKHWISDQNFNDFYFKKNKNFLFQKLEYLRLIYLVFKNKNLKLLTEILKFPKFLLKLKLLIIFFTPNFLLKLKKDYF